MDNFANNETLSFSTEMGDEHLMLEGFEGNDWDDEGGYVYSCSNSDDEDEECDDDEDDDDSY